MFKQLMLKNRKNRYMYDLNDHCAISAKEKRFTFVKKLFTIHFFKKKLGVIFKVDSLPPGFGFTGVFLCLVISFNVFQNSIIKSVPKALKAGVEIAI